MDNALVPGAEELLPRAPEPEVEPSPVQEELSQERALSSLTDHPGWSIFRDRVLGRCDDLERLVGLDVSKMTKEDVGEAFLIGRGAAAKLRDELGWVEATAAVVHNQSEEENGRKNA